MFAQIVSQTRRSSSSKQRNNTFIHSLTQAAHTVSCDMHACMHVDEEAKK